MARPSTIANHPRRHEIEQALAGNEPLRRISARFGASVTALHRHRHALATGCNKGTAIPSAAPSTGVRVGNTPAPDPFDILDAHYPWNGETPRPGPLAEVLRQQQRQHGTAGVRTAAFSIIAQHQFTGLTDTAIGRQLDVSPAHVAAWRVEQEREQLARLSPPSISGSSRPGRSCPPPASGPGPGARRRLPSTRSPGSAAFSEKRQGSA